MHPRTALLAAGFSVLLLLAAPGPLQAQDAPPEAEEAPAEPAPLSLEKILEGMKSKVLTERLAATEAAIENSDGKLLKPLVGLLKDESETVREAAIQALGNRTGDDRKKAATALAGRLKPLAKNRTDEPELLSAITSLHDLAQPCAIKALMADIEIGTSPEVVRARLFAVGNTPCDEAIETLIGEMSSGRRRGGGNARATAAEALRYATGQQYRHDPDEWRAWWKDVKKGYDHGRQARRRDNDRWEAEERKREKEETRERKERREKEREERQKKRGKQDRDAGGGDEDEDKEDDGKKGGDEGAGKSGRKGGGKGDRAD